MKLLDWLTLQATWLVFAGMVLLLFVLVIGRYVFGFSPVWIVEASQYCFVWLSFLGICVAYRRGAHISLQFVAHNAPPHIARAVTAFVHLCTIGIAIFMIYGGVELVRLFGATHSAGGTPMSWVYSALVVSGSILCALAIEQFIGAIRGIANGEGRTTFDRI